MGHDVTLFATGDSTTSAGWCAVREQAQRFAPNFEKNNAPYARLLELVRRAGATSSTCCTSTSTSTRSRCSPASRRRS